MRNNTIILTERHTHKISLKTFHLLIAPYPELRIKWGAFSGETKENIWEYFNYLIDLAKVHDPDNYDNWNYWQDVLFSRGDISTAEKKARHYRNKNDCETRVIEVKENVSYSYDYSLVTKYNKTNLN